MDHNRIYEGSCFDLINFLPDDSVDLFITSPPYADIRKYGGDVAPLHPDTYVDWCLPLFQMMYRKLKPSGSIIWNIDDKCHKGGRHPFIFELIHKVTTHTPCFLYDYYIWKKQSSLPSCGPRRINHITEFIFHFVKNSKQTKWFMDDVRVPYADATFNRAKSPIKRYGESDTGLRTDEPATIHKMNPLGKIPSNVMEFHTSQVTRGNKHPAPFNKEIPLWFIKALTEEDDLVVDPFMGSGTTALACIEMSRNYIGFEINNEYINYAKERIYEVDPVFF
jgi:site-specific DNA-methyltransferase (adenine-specific)